MDYKPIISIDLACFMIYFTEINQMIKCFFKSFNLLLALHDKVLEDGKGLDDGEQGQGMQEQGGKVQGQERGDKVLGRGGLEGHDELMGRDELEGHDEQMGQDELEGRDVQDGGWRRDRPKPRPQGGS